jgi:hypothetical protein
MWRRTTTWRCIAGGRNGCRAGGEAVEASGSVNVVGSNKISKIPLEEGVCTVYVMSRLLTRQSHGAPK